MKQNRARFFSGVIAGVALIATLGMAKADSVYVSNNYDDTIAVIASDGSISTFGNSSQLNGPTGLAFDPTSGNLFIANNGSGQIVEYTPSGTYLGVFASGLSNPRGVAFDSAGNLYVSNQSGYNVEKFNTTTGVGTIFATNLDFPNGLAFDSAGNLYVAQGNGANTITLITPGGIPSNLVITGAPLNWPNGLAFDAQGNLYVVNHADPSVEKIGPGGVGTIFATAGLSGPKTLAFDSAGDLFVTDLDNNTVTEYNSSGVLIHTFSGSFDGPCFVTTLPDSLPIPEPSTYALLLGGLGVLFFMNRRRRKLAIA